MSAKSSDLAWFERPIISWRSKLSKSIRLFPFQVSLPLIGCRRSFTTDLITGIITALFVNLVVDCQSRLIGNTKAVIDFICRIIFVYLCETKTTDLITGIITTLFVNLVVDCQSRLIGNTKAVIDNLYVGLFSYIYLRLKVLKLYNLKTEEFENIY